MTGLGNRDDELVAKIRNNIRVEARIAWSLLVAFLIISALFLCVLVFHLPMENTGMAAFAVLLVWIVLVFRAQGAIQPVAGPYDEAILRKTIDDQHRRWWWIYIFIFILVGCLAASITFPAMMILGVWHPFAGHPLLHPVAAHSLSKSNPLLAFFADHRLASLLPSAMDFAFFAVVAALQVCFGPGFRARAYRRALNDEHTRALQHSAAMFGYPLCVILMCAVLVIMTIRPQWGLVVTPGIIAACVILPGLYFLIQQWRAGRNG
jgi:hypothetical protein